MTLLSRLATTAFILWISWALPAAAQPYPAKPIRIICAFPVGGIADLYGRIIAARLGESWGQPIVVENRTGAGCTIAAENVAKSIALFAPAGTPNEIVRRWNAEVTRIMQAPDIQARLPNEGARFSPNTPEQFAGFVKAEIAKWAPVVKASGARVD